MNTHESYVSLETAKLLKDGGFDWELNSRWQDWGGKNPHEFILKTDLFYTDRPAEYDGFHALPAPTLSVAQRWLREVKGIEITIDWCIVVDGKIVDFNERGYSYHIESDYFADGSMVKFKTYEEALEDGIQKCLKLKTKITISNPHCEHDE